VAEEDRRALALPRGGGTPWDAGELRAVGVNPNPGKSLVRDTARGEKRNREKRKEKKLYSADNWALL